jgi:alpha-maltose-1-phosphate synthase
MRVLLINLNKSSGMVHYTSQLANALSTNIEVYVIGHKNNKKYFNNNINYYSFKEVNRPNLTISEILNYILHFRLIKKINPDIIHISESHDCTLFILPFVIGRPICLTLHDPNIHLGEKSFTAILNQIILPPRADGIIIHSQKFMNLGPLRKIKNDKKYVVPHGDYSFFKLKNNTNLKNMEKKIKIVLFFGRIQKYKGLEYLIKSMYLVRKIIPNSKLIIAGRGDFSIYKSLIDDENYFNVRNEYISDFQVNDLFSEADVVVLPYVEATQSGIPHIAYAFKKPVIATDTGALSEIVDHGKTGLIVPPKDENELSNAIIKLLLDDKLRLKMGENGYRKLNNDLSQDIIAKKTIDVYKKILFGIY